MKRCTMLAALVCVLATWTIAASAIAEEAASPDYNANAAPLLKKYCAWLPQPD